MPTCPAGQDDDSRERTYLLGRKAEPFEMHVALGKEHPAAQGIGHRSRLLPNLLVHEMLVAALLRHHRRPIHPLRSSVNSLTAAVEQLHLIGADHRQLALLEVDELARVLQKRGNV